MKWPKTAYSHRHLQTFVQQQRLTHLQLSEFSQVNKISQSNYPYTKYSQDGNFAMGNDSKRVSVTRGQWAANTDNHQLQNQYDPEAWLKIQDEQKYEIWKNLLNNRIYDLYRLPKQQLTSKRQVELYEFRRLYSKYLVSPDFILTKRPSLLLCTEPSASEAFLLMKHLEYRLISIPRPLTIDEGIYVLETAATGFNILQSTFYSGQSSPIPRSDMIAFDQQGKCLVWINPNFESNHKQKQSRRKSPIFDSKLNPEEPNSDNDDEKYLKRCCESLIRCVQDQTVQKFPLHLSHSLERAQNYEGILLATKCYYESRLNSQSSARSLEKIDFAEHEKHQNHLEGYVNTFSYKPLVVNSYRGNLQSSDKNPKGLTVSLVQKRGNEIEGKQKVGGESEQQSKQPKNNLKNILTEDALPFSLKGSLVDQNNFRNSNFSKSSQNSKVHFIYSSAQDRICLHTPTQSYLKNGPHYQNDNAQRSINDKTSSSDKASSHSNSFQGVQSQHQFQIRDRSKRSAHEKLLSDYDSDEFEDGVRENKNDRERVPELQSLAGQSYYENQLQGLTQRGKARKSDLTLEQSEKIKAAGQGNQLEENTKQVNHAESGKVSKGDQYWSNSNLKTHQGNSLNNSNEPPFIEEELLQYYDKVPEMQQKREHSFINSRVNSEKQSRKIKHIQELTGMTSSHTRPKLDQRKYSTKNSSFKTKNLPKNLIENIDQKYSKYLGSSKNCPYKGTTINKPFSKKPNQNRNFYRIQKRQQTDTKAPLEGKQLNQSLQLTPGRKNSTFESLRTKPSKIGIKKQVQEDQHKNPLTVKNHYKSTLTYKDLKQILRQ